MYHEGSIIAPFRLILQTPAASRGRRVILQGRRGIINVAEKMSQNLLIVLFSLSLL